MYLIKEGEHFEKITYDLYLDEGLSSARVNSQNNLQFNNEEVGTVLTLSQPLVIDARGKRVEGKYELAITNIFLTMSTL